MIFGVDKIQVPEEDLVVVKVLRSPPFSDDILGEHRLGFHVNSLGVEHHRCRLKLSHFEENRANLGKALEIGL